MLKKGENKAGTIIKHIKAVIFDCDGVLFDSKNANVKFYNSILAHFGKPPLKKSQVDYVHSHSLNDSLLYLFDSKEIDDVIEYCKGLDFKHFNKFLKVEPGLIEFLGYLKPRYKTAIATNRTVSMALVLKEFNLEEYFDLVVTAADVQRPKPHPETIIKILETFKLEPKQAVFIGDSEIDRQLADITGVIFIAYKNPELRAKYRVKSFDVIKNILENKIEPINKQG